MFIINYVLAVIFQLDMTKCMTIYVGNDRVIVSIFPSFDVAVYCVK